MEKLRSVASWHLDITRHHNNSYTVHDTWKVAENVHRTTKHIGYIYIPTLASIKSMVFINELP